jgi:sulfide:quinone oxidoreductase
MRVLIAGSGVAGLETMLALHALAEDRVELTVIAPEDEFVYRPLAASEPYTVGRTRQVSLESAARDAGAAFFPLTVEAIDAGKKLVSTTPGRRFEYDTLVLAVGAQAVPQVEHAMTWDDRVAAETMGGLLRDFEEGYARSLAVVIPPGPVWPLRAYELALMVRLEAGGMGIDVQTTIIGPKVPPLQILGHRACEEISNELERAGVSVLSTDRTEVEQGHQAVVVLQPSGKRVEVDRVLALPALRGRRLGGVPTDSQGFIEIDEHCRAQRLHDVWAVGDGTAFPIKSGGFAAEQADVAAEDIAAAAGAPVDRRSFDPTRHEELVGLPAGPFLKAWLGEGDSEELTTNLPTGATPVLTYLKRDLEAGWRGEA